MNLSTTDWLIVAAFFIVTLTIGLMASRKSGKNTSEFFLSGRNMPWWLLGVSMVATTFSADTPNLVTDIVRTNGVAGNWAWWAFLLTGMLTVFVYAKLWRRSGVVTDLEFYELRYSGLASAFLRGFRAVYLGIFFNVMIMATVMLAGIKIGGVLLGLSPGETILISGTFTVLYTALGGLRGVILTDFFQFIISMVGTVVAAVYIVNLPEVGGLTNLLAHENVAPKLSPFPDFADTNVLIPLLIIPLAVQWWSVWYPGAEPGGGGYIAQRMLSAKDEKNAIGATLFFNLAHYALRPWPWILIALASLVVFPNLQDISAAFPHVDASIVKDDLAFPAMISFLPTGLLGLVVASLIAAFMSTISTHLNWGASYVVNDVYKRFVDRDAQEKTLVAVGRITTVLLMVFSAILALYLENALQAFNILLQIGAGTGLIFILRWFWWRINAYSEIAAMVISFLIAVFFEFVYTGGMKDWQKLVTGVGITTVVWLAVALITPPDSYERLISFYKLIKPHPFGWRPIINEALTKGDLKEEEIVEGQLAKEILLMFLAVIMVYAFLFGTGYFLYGNMVWALLCFGVGGVLALVLVRYLVGLAR